jgi:hypothetical protein
MLKEGLLIETPGMVEDYDPKTRVGNPVLRWTILYGLIVFGFGTLPVWMYFITPQQIYMSIISIGISTFSLAWVLITALALVQFSKSTYSYAPLPKLPNRQFKHILVVPCYTDPLPLLVENIRSIQRQTLAHKILLFITFEAVTPDLDSKIAEIQAQLPQNVFEWVEIVVHKVNPRYENAGGCANKNYALHRAYNHVQSKYGFPKSDFRFTVTTCDTDTLFHPQYFEALEDVYNSENQTSGAPKNCVFQPPLNYNWNLANRPFFVRVTAAVRSLMTLGGLIGLNVNPMSVFSYPLELSVAGDFLNPRYSVDDIIAKVRWMCLTGSHIPVKLLPVPVVTGPTNGVDLYDEAFEWGRQLRRWNAGASEAFHFFLIHFKGTPFISGIMWLLSFLIYYAFLLCAFAPFSLLASIMLSFVSVNWEIPAVGALSPTLVGFIPLISQYIMAISAYYIEYTSSRKLLLREQDSMSIWAILLDIVLTPVALFAYGLLSFVSVCRFVIQGKRLALHDMAGKEGL